MSAEQISPVIFSEVEQPFFISDPIPFPVQKTSNNELLEELRTNWEIANEAFVQIYQTPLYGDPVKALFESNSNNSRYLLSEIGQPFGFGDKNKVRKVRSALNLGREKRVDEHDSYWSFTDLEMAQFMVGVVAKKYKNECTNALRKKRTDIINV